MRKRISYGAAAVLLAAAALAGAAAKSDLTPDVQAALGRISADSLRGHVSFLASDLLEGRATPSPGLDVAAEYIAAQFRRAALEPAGDDGYYETANFVNVKPNFEGFELVLEGGGKTIRVSKEEVAPASALSPLELSRAGVLKASWADNAEMARWTPEQAQGKVIIAAGPNYASLDQEGRRKAAEALRSFRERLPRLKPALVIMLGRQTFRETSRLIDPSDPQVSAAARTIQVNNAELLKAYEAMKPGPAEATVTFRQAAPIQEPVKLHNVAGILRGSDPALKDSYVLVTAHYDHVGVRAGGEGDRIYNGANDDASGTAAVMELAATLSKLNQRPKRSIVFMTYFGEEKGLLGSRYYGRHPVVPAEKTVADINLEQLGRTDDSDGPQVARATLTGFDYTDIGPIFQKAGELTGISVYKNEKNSDSFFARSDNQAMADLGIPSHTLLVAYVFPDYHRPGDEWQKLDYANMAKVDRMVAVGLLMIADNPEPPKWNEANPKAERYVRAWKKMRAQN